jgi:hypothetical protein
MMSRTPSCSSHRIRWRVILRDKQSSSQAAWKDGCCGLPETRRPPIGVETGVGLRQDLFPFLVEDFLGKTDRIAGSAGEKDDHDRRSRLQCFDGAFSCPAILDQTVSAIEFTGPIHDLAFVVGHIKVDLAVRISKPEFGNYALQRYRVLNVIRDRGSVMGGYGNGNAETKDDDGYEQQAVFGSTVHSCTFE